MRIKLPPKYEDRRILNVNGVERTYWVAPSPAGAPPGPRPLLLGFHGLGSSGSRMAWWGRLDDRGPLAGFHCVFPDALEPDHIWDDHGCGRRDGADDVLLVTMLVEHLASTGAIDPARIFLTGGSTGAAFAERLARSGAVPAAGIALVAGTARVASTSTTPIDPGSRTAALIVVGTSDPMVPWNGGLPGGALGKLAMRRVRNTLNDPSGHEAVGPEVLAADWAAANGCTAEPTIEHRINASKSWTVDKLTWDACARTDLPVTLYRIGGGGHGWPGGREYMGSNLVGRVPDDIDTTSIVLAFAQAAIAARVAGEPSGADAPA